MSYYVNFSNQAELTWTMVIYLVFPGSVSLNSLAWLQATAPHNGINGVEWNVDLQVVLGEFEQATSGESYVGSQILGTSLGSMWEIVLEDNVQRLKYVGDLSSEEKDSIKFINNSGLTANPGIGMSYHPAVVKPNVQNNEEASFKVLPLNYYMALWTEISQGEVISSDEVSNNMSVVQQLKFSGGTNEANVTALPDGEMYYLKVDYTIRSA